MLVIYQFAYYGVKIEGFNLDAKMNAKRGANVWQQVTIPGARGPILQ